MPTTATITVMAAAAPIGPGAGSVASVTIHKMTVSTTQTEPIIFDGKFMPAAVPPRIDLRGFVLWVSFERAWREPRLRRERNAR